MSEGELKAKANDKHNEKDVIKVSRMTNQGLRTLAYSKSPKQSKRTTFQDELQAAVSARAKKATTDHLSYSDDFDDDDVDDFLSQLLESRKKKTEAFKAGKSKAKAQFNTFDLSGDEDKPVKTKRVSFLKSQRIEDEPPNPPSGDQCNGHNNSNSSQNSANVSGPDMQSKHSDDEPDDQQTPRETLSKSLSPQTSDDTFLDLPLPLSSESNDTQTPGLEERGDTVVNQRPQSPTLSEPDLGHMPLADIPTEREPPKPKPRQRTLALSSRAAVKTPEESDCQDLSRPQTSSTSIPLSSDMSSNAAVRSCSPHLTEDEGSGSHSLSKSSSSKSDETQPFSKSASGGSESRGDCFSDSNKELNRKSPTSLEELREAQTEPSGHSAPPLSHQKKKMIDTRIRPQSACYRKVESKYLGALKVLDRKVSLQDSQPPEGNTLRAAIYQEWLKKKRLTSRDIRQRKKEEEILREKKKQEEETKKGEAIASYEAWKEKKAESYKEKAKEKQQLMRKEQKANEEKEEKRQTAQQMFEKWKQEHDQLRRHKHRKQKEAEDKRQLKKQGREEERKRESLSVFSQWCEKKKDVIHEKVASQRKESKTKAEEERYMKEERDKMALETYENWLMRKDLEQKRQREERQIKAILRDSPPPPWSPPNKTIAYSGLL